MLRFDAERFDAAEYDDVDRWGSKPSLVRRLAWYTLGIGGILAVLWIHPNPATDLFLGLGDRLSAVMLGLAYGAIGTAIALGIALYRYHTVRLPPVMSYPGAILNAVATAFFDEAVFRGLLFGYLLAAGIQPNLANLIQALDLRPRDAARGARPAVVHAVHGARDRPRRRLADRDHRRHRRGVPGPLDHPGRDLPDDRPRRHPEGGGHRDRGGRAPAGGAEGLARARVRRGHAGPVARGAEAPAGATIAARPPVALYVHVPFCVSLCPYCDFVVYAGAAARGPRARVDAFTWRPCSPRSTCGRTPSTARSAAGGPRSTPLYLGGGTPTLLPSSSIAAIVGLARERFGLAGDAEVTIEANPGPDERGDARALVDAGINRLSMGAQSFDAGLLRRLGRRHGPGDVADAIGRARTAGIPSISLDLLYDVPGQTEAAWAASIEAAIALEPDHVSAYALTLDDPDAEGLTGPTGDHLPTRAGARRWRTTAIDEQDDDRAAAQYGLAVDRLGAAGFRGYEISNWARPGRESRHNLAYWTRQPYEAVGPGAHAFDGAIRRWNAARLDGYLAALAPADGSVPTLPPGGREPVDDAAAAVESTILGLRLDTGVSLAEAEEGPLAPHLAWAFEHGLLEPFEQTDRRRASRPAAASSRTSCSRGSSETGSGRAPAAGRADDGSNALTPGSPGG